MNISTRGYDETGSNFLQMLVEEINSFTITGRKLSRSEIKLIGMILMDQ